MTTLFSLVLPQNGTIVCTQPAEKVYLITFAAPPDNRLVSDFCKTLILALDIIERRYPRGVVITTSGIQKFYSNGLDLEHALKTEGFFPDALYYLWARLLMYPMPTVALVNGHAFAGALMLAMYHDYRVFNPSRGFLCLNELDFGVPLKPPMSQIFKHKCTPQTYRSLVLEAKRYGGKDALQDGLVDALGGLDETLELIASRKLTEKGVSNIYHLMKMEMYRDVLVDIDDYHNSERMAQHRDLVVEQSDKAAEQRVQTWEARSNSKL